MTGYQTEQCRRDTCMTIAMYSVFVFACLVSLVDPCRDVRVAPSEPLVYMCNRGDITSPLYNLKGLACPTELP